VPPQSPRDKRRWSSRGVRAAGTGIGAGGLVVAAAIVGFAALTGLVAFDGLPEEGASSRGRGIRPRRRPGASGRRA